MSSFLKQPLPVFPLYRPNLRHTGTGADRKTGKTTPLPPNRHPFGRVATIVSRKRRNAHAIVLSSLYKPSSAHLSFFSQSPKSTDERDRSVFKPPARPTASYEQQYMQPWQPPQYSALTWCVPCVRLETNRGSNGGGVSAASSQANRDHIAQQRQYSSGSLAVVLQQQQQQQRGGGGVRRRVIKWKWKKKEKRMN